MTRSVPEFSSLTANPHDEKLAVVFNDEICVGNTATQIRLF
jgi:hypothetical protein